MYEGFDGTEIPLDNDTLNDCLIDQESTSRKREWYLVQPIEYYGQDWFLGEDEEIITELFYEGSQTDFFCTLFAKGTFLLGTFCCVPYMYMYQRAKLPLFQSLLTDRGWTDECGPNEITSPNGTVRILREYPTHGCFCYERYHLYVLTKLRHAHPMENEISGPCF